jgi:peptide/nickel transport system permease protein
MIVVVFIVSLFMYLLFSIAPGGPLTGLQQQQRRLTPEDKARIRAQYELDLYWPVRYLRWLAGVPSGPIVIAGQEWFANVPMGCYMEGTPEEGGCKDYVYLAEIPELHPAVKSSQGILRLDFGKSTVIQAGQPVWDLVSSRLSATIELQIIHLVLAIIIAVPLGIYSAVRQYSKFDFTFTTLAFVGSSMPTFFFGLLFILVFTVFAGRIQEVWPWWPTLPPGLQTAVRPYEVASWLPKVQPGSPLDHFLHLLMPVAVLTLVTVATWSRFLRSSMLDVLRQDYVRTARAKGLKEAIVINRHALRNALIPFITILVLQLPLLFAGAIVTETVFAWPGMGRMFNDALQRSDYNVALAFIYVITILTVVATLLGDILYAVVDPRIRYS